MLFGGGFFIEAIFLFLIPLFSLPLFRLFLLTGIHVLDMVQDGTAVTHTGGEPGIIGIMPSR